MKELLYIARAALEAEFSRKKLEIPSEVKEKYNEKRACFVTLTKDGDLRGCIGSLQTHQELWKDVVDNAINAGFRDYRFSSLEREELDEIKIEISVLTKPQKLGRGEEVFERIDKNMGIILKHGRSSSTFLPQVWEELPDKVVFLEQLSVKAGLDKDAWKDSEIEFYKVEKIKE